MCADLLKLEPSEFERFVKSLLDEEGLQLLQYHSAHLNTLVANDGSYTFDITAEFEAMGARYLTVIECKRYSKPIERELVQALYTKMQSVSANKAMMVTTSGYRRGALQFAKAHGIALIIVEDGQLQYETKDIFSTKQMHGFAPNYAAKLVQYVNSQSTSSWRLGALYGPFGKEPARLFLSEFLKGNEV